MKAFFIPLVYALAIFGQGAAAQETRKTGPATRSPFLAVVFSAACPGGGQVYTQNYLKAGLAAGAVGTMAFFYLRENKRMEQAFRLSEQTGLQQDIDDYDGHYERRRQYQWWGVGIWAFSMLDAYVDAHLFKFDDRSEPPLSLRVAPNAICLSRRF